MRTIVLMIALMLAVSGFSQDSIPKMIFGFNVGTNYSNIQIKDPDAGVKLNNRAGFSLGVLMDARLCKHLSFSPKAEIAFNNSNITITKDPDEKMVYLLYPASINCSFHFNYKFCNSKTAPYILIGQSCKIPLANDKKAKQATTQTCFSADIGIGLDKKLTYFNIAPELRYSYGLNNVKGLNGVGQLYYHQITLALVFKG
jgi:hypothetical protein